MKRVILLPVYAFILLSCAAGCQTGHPADRFMTRDMKTGMSESEVREAKGEPFEIEVMPGGGKRLGYVFEAREIKNYGWGMRKETPMTVRRFDVFVGPWGVERFTTADAPELSPALALFRQANAANTKGDFQTALEALDRLLMLRPYHSLARAIRASIYTRLENKEAALQDYRFLIRNDPGNSLAHHNLAVFYYESGQIGESIESFNAALKGQPNSGLSLAYRARAYAKAGKPAQAQADIAAAKAAGFVFTPKLAEELRALGVTVD